MFPSDKFSKPPELLINDSKYTQQTLSTSTFISQIFVKNVLGDILLFISVQWGEILTPTIVASFMDSVRRLHWGKMIMSSKFYHKSLKLGKRANLKTSVWRNEARQIFCKNEHFFVFGKFGPFCFFEAPA